MKDTDKTTWSILMKIIIAIASAILGALGGAATSLFMN